MWDVTSDAYQQFNTIAHDEVMFMTGDKSTHCVVKYPDLITTQSSVCHTHHTTQSITQNVLTYNASSSSLSSLLASSSL